MPDRIGKSIEPIDAGASKVVAAAIGERLRTEVHAEKSELPLRLQLLLDELHARDRDTR